MADNQTVASKRRRISDLGSSNRVVPCNECIRIQLKLIKAEGNVDVLTTKCSKHVEKIQHQANQIKQLQKTIKQLSIENQQLKNKFEQDEQRRNIVSIE